MATKIHLIKPPTPTLHGNLISRPPLELLSLASAIRDKEFINLLSEKYEYALFNTDTIEVKISDWSNIEDIKCLNDLINKSDKYDIIGITSTTPQIDYACYICNLVKSRFPQTLTIIGGAHVTLNAQNILDNSLFDVICLGESIETFPLLISDYIHNANWRTNGIYVKKCDGSYIYRPKVEPKIPLDQYPLSSASVDLINIEDYDQSGFQAHEGQIKTPIALIQTNVGCYNNCAFCAAHKVAKYRLGKSISRVVEDMLGYHSKGFRLFHITDDIFCDPVERPLELSKLLKSAFPKGNIEWVYNVRADHNFMKSFSKLHVNNALKNYFRNCLYGYCRGISIGVETGDESLLSSIDKYTRIKDVINITKSAIDVGLGVKWYLMVGLPDQNWHSIKKTIQLIKNCTPTGLAVSILVPHPGTKYYNDHRIRIITNNNLKMIGCPEPPERYSTNIKSPIETSTMSKEEIAKARELIIEEFLAARSKNIYISHNEFNNIKSEIDNMVGIGNLY